MKISSKGSSGTRICGSNPETIIIRGKDLAQELIGQVSFTDHVWLLITGEMPTAQQRRILDSTLVAIAEHGLVPSVVAARMTLAAAPEAVQGAVAAGLLGCGSVILGSSQAAGEFLAKVVEAEKSVGREEAIRSTVADYRAAKLAVPGFGHPLHKTGDPRARRLFEVAREEGLFGPHCEAAHEAERMMPDLVSRPLVMNVSAAIPSVLLDAGYPLLALKGVPLLARTASLIAHLLEEQADPIGFEMAGTAAQAIAFTGDAPEGFVADES